MFREHSIGELNLTAVVPVLLDTYTDVVAKPYQYNANMSWGVYYLRFKHRTYE
nr:unnamed protein product [Callosobruchus chinensis]